MCFWITMVMVKPYSKFSMIGGRVGGGGGGVCGGGGGRGNVIGFMWSEITIYGTADASP